jgi:hypothetical protein
VGNGGINTQMIKYQPCSQPPFKGLKGCVERVEVKDAEVQQILPCAYEGKETIPPGGRNLNDKASLKKWLFCDHPKRIELGLAEKVCACACNSNCRGYVAET